MIYKNLFLFIKKQTVKNSFVQKPSTQKLENNFSKDSFNRHVSNLLQLQFYLVCCCIRSFLFASLVVVLFNQLCSFVGFRFFRCIVSGWCSGGMWSRFLLFVSCWFFILTVVVVRIDIARVAFNWFLVVIVVILPLFRFIIVIVVWGWCTI